MDVSRSRKRESARDRGQEIRVWRGTEADGQGHKIKADRTIAAPECNCEANWAKEHLGRVQGSTSHASLELEKGLQAEAQRGILFLKPPSSVPLPIALAKCHLPLPRFQKKGAIFWSKDFLNHLSSLSLNHQHLSICSLIPSHIRPLQFRSVIHAYRCAGFILLLIHSLFSSPLFHSVSYLEKCSDKIILKHHRTTGGRTEAYCYTAMVYLFPLQSLFLPLVS